MPFACAKGCAKVPVKQARHDPPAMRMRSSRAAAELRLIMNVDASAPAPSARILRRLCLVRSLTTVSLLSLVLHAGECRIAFGHPARRFARAVAVGGLVRPPE